MNDIELILDQINQEKALLNKLIENCLDGPDKDYFHAHLFQQAIRSGGSFNKIILKRTLEPNTGEISKHRRKADELRSHIEILEHRLKRAPKDHPYRNNMLEYLVGYKEELDKLNNKILGLVQTNRPKYIDSDQLIIALEELLNTKGTDLYLEFFDYCLYYISVRNKGETIYLEFLRSERDEKDRDLGKGQKRRLRNLGFTEINSFTFESKLQLEIATPEYLQRILSILYFETIYTDPARYYGTTKSSKLIIIKP